MRSGRAAQKLDGKCAEQQRWTTRREVCIYGDGYQWGIGGILLPLHCGVHPCSGLGPCVNGKTEKCNEQACAIIPYMSINNVMYIYFYEKL